MRYKMGRLLIAIVLFVFISGSFAPDLFAQNPVRKLGRGLASTLTGFLEIPVNVVEAAEEDGYVAAITYGVIEGLAMSVVRTAVGIYETVTFLIPFPGGYEPILEPEFLMSPDKF